MDKIDNRLYEFKEIPYKFWKKKGMAYYAESEMEYLTSELMSISEVESRQYQDACTELYLMYERAAQYVIDHNLWKDLGIPENCIDIIKYSWEHRRRLLHLYGRFDLAGIIDGLTPKLIEFNADTATVMPETAIIQKEQFGKAKIGGGSFQFNNLHKAVTTRFEELARANPRKRKGILLSDMGHPEDAMNTDIITAAAKKAGFETQQTVLDQVHFSTEHGIMIHNVGDDYTAYDYWFKLVPWEFLAYEEPELMKTLTEIVRKDLCVILNPAYTMIFQSKAIMKVLWDLYPNHYLLLKTSYDAKDLLGKPFVKKVIYGREGENVQVFNKNGDNMESNGGDFGHYPSVYQEFVPLPQDIDDDIYQAG
ncbi:MAG: glutathionylspermidine synthase family protein, partial [Saprospiraceae bacterium]